MRPLRVALLAPHDHPLTEPLHGGAETHVWSLSRALRQHGHDVVLFAPPGSDGVPPEHTYTRAWSPSETAQNDPSMPELTQMQATHDYLRILLGLAEGRYGDIDVVHNACFHPLPIAMAPALTAPMITALHTPPTPWLESGIATAAEAGPGRPSRFVAVSAATARAWTRLPGPAAVVPNGVDLDRWRPGPGGGPLVWSGRITPEKGTHLAVEAARRADRPLVIAGPVADERYFRSLVEPCLGNDARYAGHLGQEDLADLVRNASAVLVTPRWEEPFGLVVAEALACGTPVAAFARGGVPEVLGGPEHGGLAPADDVEALAAEVEHAVTLDRGAIARYAREHLSIDTMTDRYVDLYRRLRDGRWDS